MARQMTLELGQTEQLVTVWDKLDKASRQELTRRLAGLLAVTAQAQLGSARKESCDEHHEL